MMLFVGIRCQKWSPRLNEEPMVSRPIAEALVRPALGRSPNFIKKYIIVMNVVTLV